MRDCDGNTSKGEADLRNRCALSAEIDRREGYEVRLLAALLICTQPLGNLLLD